MPSSRDLPDPGIKPASLMSLTLAAKFFTTSATWEAPPNKILSINNPRTGVLNGMSVSTYKNENHHHAQPSQEATP